MSTGEYILGISTRSSALVYVSNEYSLLQGCDNAWLMTIHVLIALKKLTGYTWAKGISIEVPYLGDIQKSNNEG